MGSRKGSLFLFGFFVALVLGMVQSVFVVGVIKPRPNEKG